MSNFPPGSLDSLVAGLMRATHDYRADVLRPIKQLASGWRESVEAEGEWVVDGKKMLADLEDAIAQSDDYEGSHA